MIKIEPVLRELTEKKLIGKSLSMSLENNKTNVLWSQFMPRRKEIAKSKNSDLFSIQIYPSDFDFKNFNLSKTFEKWAAVEVSELSEIPADLQSLVLEAGLYAVFHYKGNPAEAESFFRYIFETWLPASDYKIDTRPHFEIIGEKYKNNDPNSEEEVWIPIKRK